MGAWSIRAIIFGGLVNLIATSFAAAQTMQRPRSAISVRRAVI
jgi:hypothetical protein